MVSIFSLFYFAFVTRLFSKLDISVLAVVGVVNAFGGSIGGLGLMTLALQRVPALRANNRQDDAARMLGSGTVVSIAGAAFVAALIAIMSKPLSVVFFKTANTHHLIIAASILLISYKAYESVNLSMQALDNFRMVTRLRILNDIFLRMLGIPAYLLGGIIGYMFTLASGQLVISAIAFGIEFKQMPLRVFWDWRLIRALVRESLPFYGFSVLRFGTVQADSLLVGVLLRPDALATYYVIRRFYDYLAQFFDAMLTPLIPKVAERRECDGRGVADAFHKSSRYVLAICISTAVLLLPLSGQFLAVFGGTKYMNGVPGLRIFFVAAALYGLYSFHSSFVLAAASPRASLSNEILASFSNLVLSTWLVASYSVTGGAGGKMIAIAFVAVASFWVLSRSVPAKPNHDWGLLKDVLPVTASGSCAILLVQIWIQNVPMIFLMWAGMLILMLYWIIRRSNHNDIDFISKSLKLERLPFGGRILRLARISY